MAKHLGYRTVDTKRRLVYATIDTARRLALDCITEEPYDCNKCLDCCFSTISKAEYSYEVTDSGSPPEPIATILTECPGILTSAGANITQSAVTRWSEAFEYAGAGQDTGVFNNCLSGSFWQFIRHTRVAVREIDGEPITYEVVCDPTYSIPNDTEWSYYIFEISVIRSRAQSDCCGFTMTGGSFSIGVNRTDSTGTGIGDAYITTWTGNASVEITNNQCCLNAEEECEEEFPADCDGECNPV